MSDPTLPLTIIGGYLGAGKTTLVNHLLRNAQGQRLAVLVNEFGSLPIDADLIEAQDGDLTVLAGGCVCCSYGDDLMFALRQIRKLDPAPDHVLLEASGVALPGAIGSAIGLFGDDIRVHGIVILSDAETLPGHLSDIYISDTISRQLDSADVVILTKSDLASPDQMRRSLNIVHEHAPLAGVIESRGQDVDSELILSHIEALRKPGQSREGHNIRLVTNVLAMSEPVDPETFAQKLSADPDILRAKGHMISVQNQQPVTLQLVGRRYTITGAAPTAKPGVVVIRKDHSRALA